MPQQFKGLGTMAQTTKLSWSFMTLGAVLIGLYALGITVAPSLRGEFVLEMLDVTGFGTIFHFVSGGAVIILGALQFHSGLRAGYPQFHRWMGRIYVAGVMLGGVSGLYLAIYSTGGIVAHWGFGALAICWLFSTGKAFLHVRNGQVREHRIWMIRSYALTLAALTLRIYIPITQIAGVDFDAAYRAIAWMAWVPNLIIAEWVLIPRLSAKSGA